MKISNLNFFKCPETKDSLEIKVENTLIEDELIDGILTTTDNQRQYFVKNGIPDFTIWSERAKNNYAIDLFKSKADEYDKYQHLSFETFYQEENAVRNSMIDKLYLKENSKVLEVNAGTGRDSVLISKRLSKDGILHVQDISGEMLSHCKIKLNDLDTPFEIHQGNASRLPYENQSFDAVYSFGGVGMNTYLNNKDAIAEMVRVTKPGGRIVFGGLSLAPWLRQTLFGKILTNHNSHYSNVIEFQDLPVTARNLNVNWILEGAGFVIDFTVGIGEPNGNFNYEIPGPRGGTLLTRYYGNLEGVTEETKEMAIKAQKKTGLSMHVWLEKLIKTEAENILKNKP
jgi:ubiquinone/menaquinone biosynthesis C-methylase UbiE